MKSSGCGPPMNRHKAVGRTSATGRPPPPFSRALMVWTPQGMPLGSILRGGVDLRRDHGADDDRCHLPRRVPSCCSSCAHLPCPLLRWGNAAELPLNSATVPRRARRRRFSRRPTPRRRCRWQTCQPCASPTWTNRAPHFGLRWKGSRRRRGRRTVSAPRWPPCPRASSRRVSLGVCVCDASDFVWREARGGGAGTSHACDTSDWFGGKRGGGRLLFCGRPGLWSCLPVLFLLSPHTGMNDHLPTNRALVGFGGFFPVSSSLRFCVTPPPSPPLIPFNSIGS